MPAATVGPAVVAVRHHKRVVAEAAAEQVARIDKADQRAVDAHHAAGAKPLQRARHQQALQRPRAGAGERCQREQRQAAEIDALVADDLAERAERQNCCHQCDLVDIDDPDDIRRADAQVGGDGGQRDIGNRGVERGHGKRGEDRENGPSSALGRQTVGRQWPGHRTCLFQHRGKNAPADRLAAQGRLAINRRAAQ
jgi:hypothetical protein